MIFFIVLALLIGFVLGWVCKDYKWVAAAKNKKFAVVDGKLYVVKEHKNTHVGGE